MILDIDELNLAVDAVTQGGVIAYPTEAVWGLGCNPWNQEAVNRLLAIKSRPVEKGVILVGFAEEQFSPILDPLTDSERERLTSGWPGPYTWLIPDPDGWTPKWIRGQFDTVAIRISDHPIVRYLCSATGLPLVSTSANKAGEPPLLTKEQVEQQFSGQVDFIVPGELGSQQTPSEIRDLKTNRVIRAG
ncbi:L-threonylcarbamoyladenylate synthase [Endozoicomonas sp. Mp262]|uniref:L-threonylcarbamoyladenylate synthase n=1 Tax=Endozoicomonas sp. Mp262 TaxID=2919499 RepID=UPI0021D9140E